MSSSLRIRLNWPLHTPAQNHRTIGFVTKNAEILVRMFACRSHLPTDANLQDENKEISWKSPRLHEIHGGQQKIHQQFKQIVID